MAMQILDDTMPFLDWLSKHDVILVRGLPPVTQFSLTGSWQRCTSRNLGCK